MDDKLYDSLDDEEIMIKSLSDISLNSTINVIVNNAKYELSEFIPFYNGDVIKNRINVSKKDKFKRQSKIPVLANINVKAKNICNELNDPIDNTTDKHKKKRSRNKPEEFLRPKEENTYLKLFYTKIGYPNKTCQNLNDTTRGTDGDLSYRTASSGSMEYSDAKTPQSLSDSEKNFYFNHIEKERIVPPLNLSNRNSSVFIRSYPNNTITNLKSRTCQNLSRYSWTSGGNTNYAINIPTLGGLGPDMYSAKDKQLKKRKEYGQNASNKNRLKILEGKLLNNLEIATNNLKNV